MNSCGKFLAAVLVLLAPGLLKAEDKDRDGIADALESQLLQQFAPRFLVSGGECDTLPAEFQPGLVTPRVAARNGTIYGQVFRHPERPEFLELHYYHLWGRDCGRRGHPLDTEHVSALVVYQHDSWRALYWYAAAHEDTLCAANVLAYASVLDATEHGPEVEISAGKHASSFRRAESISGCGVDTYREGSVLSGYRVINVGEPQHPLNGALWTRSLAWPLAQKMTTNFPFQAIEELEAMNQPGVVVHRHVRAQAVIRVSNRTTAKIGRRRDRTQESVSNAIDRAQISVGDSLKTAARATRERLRFR